MRTVYLDIECSPNLADVWQLFQTNVSLAQLRESSRMIAFAAKWRGERKTEFYSEFADRVEMLGRCWEILNEADVMVTYNGDRFDIPTMNRELLLAGLKPPAPLHSLDIYKVIKRKFRFASHKLDHVTRELGLPGKVHHEGHTLWVKCMAGDPAAWKRMEKYNIRDVTILEQLHNKVLPWISGGPNLRLYDETEGCPNCGSKHLAPQGHRYTQSGKYPRWKCKDCGAWSTSGRREYGTDLRSI